LGLSRKCHKREQKVSANSETGSGLSGGHKAQDRLIDTFINF